MLGRRRDVGPARDQLEHAAPHRRVVKGAGKARVEDAALGLRVPTELRHDVDERHRGDGLEPDDRRAVLRVAGRVGAAERERRGVAAVAEEEERARVADPDLHVVALALEAEDGDGAGGVAHLEVGLALRVLGVAVVAPPVHLHAAHEQVAVQRPLAAPVLLVKVPEARRAPARAARHHVERLVVVGGRAHPAGREVHPVGVRPPPHGGAAEVHGEGGVDVVPHEQRQTGDHVRGGAGRRRRAVGRLQQRPRGLVVPPERADRRVRHEVGEDAARAEQRLPRAQRERRREGVVALGQEDGAARRVGEHGAQRRRVVGGEVAPRAARLGVADLRVLPRGQPAQRVRLDQVGRRRRRAHRAHQQRPVLQRSVDVDRGPVAGGTPGRHYRGELGDARPAWPRGDGPRVAHRHRHGKAREEDILQIGMPSRHLDGRLGAAAAGALDSGVEDRERAGGLDRGPGRAGVGRHPQPGHRERLAARRGVLQRGDRLVDEHHPAERRGGLRRREPHPDAPANDGDPRVRPARSSSAVQAHRRVARADRHVLHRHALRAAAVDSHRLRVARQDGDVHRGEHLVHVDVVVDRVVQLHHVPIKPCVPPHQQRGPAVARRGGGTLQHIRCRPAAVRLELGRGAEGLDHVVAVGLRRGCVEVLLQLDALERSRHHIRPRREEGGEIVAASKVERGLQRVGGVRLASRIGVEWRPGGVDKASGHVLGLRRW